MSDSNRRIHRRANVRLAMSSISSHRGPLMDSQAWTSNISAGGMYFHAPSCEKLAPQSNVSFELQIPPGSGYSISGGTIKGTGQVIRTDSLSEHGQGVALIFSKPLEMFF